MSVSSPNTSASLLDRVRRHSDADAWGRLVRLYTPLLHVWLHSVYLQAADVDDLTQRVLEILTRKLPDFQHNGRPGAFRTWLRGITVNLLREHRRVRPVGQGPDNGVLSQLEDHHSEMSRRWDREHDEHLLHGLLELVRPEFSPSSWEAFRRQMLDEQPAARAAAELGISVNAVLIAKSRVLARLRREARGLIEE